ncbi:MAG: biotin transporter BioY [Clostridia bacterium]|nr:biotin transporter BioY [Clostridia bacterium]
MTAASFFAAVIAITAQFAIPLPSGFPFTLQTFAVCLCGYCLGVKNSLLSVAVYILIGAVGAPVFGGFQGGIHHLAGFTGGFIIGFLPMAALCGAGRTRKGAVAVLCGVCGIVCCHILGTLWYSFVAGTGIEEAFVLVLTFFALKDIASCIAAFAVSGILNRILRLC